MKTPLACAFSLVLTTLMISGCGQDTKPTPPPAPTPVASTPPPPPPPNTNLGKPIVNGGYLGAMVNAQQSAIKTIDLTSLNQEIQLFNAQEGRNPKDLNELVTAHYIGALPITPAGKKLSYDAVQGKVTLANTQ